MSQNNSGNKIPYFPWLFMTLNGPFEAQVDDLCRPSIDIFESHGHFKYVQECPYILVGQNKLLSDHVIFIDGHWRILYFP